MIPKEHIKFLCDNYLATDIRFWSEYNAQIHKGPSRIVGIYNHRVINLKRKVYIPFIYKKHFINLKNF